MVADLRIPQSTDLINKCIFKIDNKLNILNSMETTSKYGKCVACVTNQTSLEERIKQLVDKVDVANLKYS